MLPFELYENVESNREPDVPVKTPDSCQSFAMSATASFLRSGSAKRKPWPYVQCRSRSRTRASSVSIPSAVVDMPSASARLSTARTIATESGSRIIPVAMRELGVEPDFLYEPSGGLTLAGGIGVFVIAAVARRLATRATALLTPEAIPAFSAPFAKARRCAARPFSVGPVFRPSAARSRIWSPMATPPRGDSFAPLRLNFGAFCSRSLTWQDPDANRGLCLQPSDP